MKKLMLLAVFVLLMLANFAEAYVSLSSSATTTPSTIEPGQSANLILTLNNIGTTTAQNVKLRIKAHSFIKASTTLFEIQSIPNGNSVQVTVPITISSAATEGTTALQFTIDYNDAADPTGVRTQENSATISITKRALLEINKIFYDKAVIQPGDNLEMSIELKNVGKGSIKDLSVSIYNTTLPFVATETSSRFLDRMNPGEMKNATFEVMINKDAKTIAHSIPVTLTYYDESNALQTSTKYVGLKISGFPEFVVSVEKMEKMYSGNMGKLSISVSNRGTAIAQFLTAEFDSNFETIPKEYYIGNLDPDDSSTISVEINLKKIAAGAYPLNVALKYKDPYNKELSDEHTINIEVTNQPFEISSTTQIIIFFVVAGILYWKRNFVMKIFKRK